VYRMKNFKSWIDNKLLLKFLSLIFKLRLKLVNKKCVSVYLEKN